MTIWQINFYMILKDIWVDPSKYFFILIEEHHVLIYDKISKKRS